MFIPTLIKYSKVISLLCSFLSIFCIFFPQTVEWSSSRHSTCKNIAGPRTLPQSSQDRLSKVTRKIVQKNFNDHDVALFWLNILISCITLTDKTNEIPFNWYFTDIFLMGHEKNIWTLTTWDVLTDMTVLDWVIINCVLACIRFLHYWPQYMFQPVAMFVKWFRWIHSYSIIAPFCFHWNYYILW